MLLQFQKGNDICKACTRFTRSTGAKVKQNRCFECVDKTILKCSFNWPERREKEPDDRPVGNERDALA